MNRIFTLLFLWLAVTSVKADEGMWLPLFVDRLNYEDMQKMGLRLSAEEIYSINHGSLKDAIVIFGGGCTGEIVSDQGLIFTNHHCGYASIAALSTVNNDILTNGFCAQSQKDELYPASDLSVRFLVRIEDVSKPIINAIPFDVTEQERAEFVKKKSKEIEAQASEGDKYIAEVKSFFFGNEYYLFVYQEFSDVRLVMTPPSAIGKFGGDTDNWMWPRHTCDFSVFRVYADANNNPAPYSRNNVPYKPKKALGVSLKGVKVNDFAMIMGYPGRTNRYLSSYGVDMAYQVTSPATISIREKKLAVMDEGMKHDDNVRLRYASRYASTANYYKYYIGQNKGIERLKVIDRKRILEDNFESWANNENIAKRDYYRDAIPKIQNSYSKLYLLSKVKTYLSECFLRGPATIVFANKFQSLEKELSAEKPNVDNVEKLTQSLRVEMVHYFDNFSFLTEKNMLREMMKIYVQNIPEIYQPAFFKEIRNKFKNDYRMYADYVFGTSVFTDPSKLNEFLNTPVLPVLKRDAYYIISQNVYTVYRQVLAELNPLELQLELGMRKYVKGLREMQKDKKFYPDANSTMRLTYGKVLPYSPKDGIDYLYYSTLDGVMEKEDSTNEDFEVPVKLKELWKAKDYGQYGENGVMKTCFLTNNDITGGNSGSPVMNGNGELIGLAFDANWEAMSGDIVFEPELQRCIVVDIRYVLFIIDKYAGGKWIVDELKISK